MRVFLLSSDYLNSISPFQPTGHHVIHFVFYTIELQISRGTKIVVSVIKISYN